MAELGSGPDDPAAGDGPAFPNYCPRCGAALTAPRCPTCLALSQLRHTGAELERWQAQGLLSTETMATLRQDLLDRSQDAIARASGRLPRATASQPLPAPESRPEARPQPSEPNPREPVAPTEWDRFREATGVSWVYAVGVLFLVAGMAQSQGRASAVRSMRSPQVIAAGLTDTLSARTPAGSLSSCSSTSCAKARTSRAIRSRPPSSVTSNTR